MRALIHLGINNPRPLDARFAKGRSRRTVISFRPMRTLLAHPNRMYSASEDFARLRRLSGSKSLALATANI